MKALLTLLMAAGAVSSVSAQDSTVYGGVVEKIINTYCIKCHTPEKHKGKLVLATYADVMKGGESQEKGKKTVDAGKSASSLLYTSTTVADDDDAHMPPAEKPQPNANDKAILKWWIDGGAKADEALATAAVPAELKAAVAEWAAKKVEKPAPVAPAAPK
jgi:Planctomycete cytochrome C